MGTRADFYVGRGLGAEWLGSIAWDGHPDSIDATVIGAGSETEFRSAVADFLASRDDATLPDQGWPWPWSDSRTTDYAYAFDGKVMASRFGHKWFDVGEPEPESDSPESAVFPDMSERSRFTLGPRSGVIVFGA